MTKFPLSLDPTSLADARRIGGRLGVDSERYFVPRPRVAAFLASLTEDELVRPISVSGADGYRALQQQLQSYGEDSYNGTKAAYLNVIALALWELCRRSTGHTPTFGEIAALAVAAGVQASRTV